MDLDLTGTTALVTGASRGIGLATVHSLIAEGVHVIGTARSVTAELAATGAVTVAADLTVPADVERLIATAGPLDLLVNNAGGGDDQRLKSFADTPDEDWQALLEINLFAAVRTIRAALPGLIARCGTVVNVSSIGARVPSSGPAPYNCAKAALTALGAALNEELAPSGIRVVTVSPGPTRTAIWEAPGGLGANLAAMHGLAHAELLQRVPGTMGMTSGRLVEPDEVAALITFLASPRAASITGSDHRVDGGLVKSV
jgi:NAD(P)-dependent dehydrogenase (short-subunit alcohol dehydrogenase family)